VEKIFKNVKKRDLNKKNVKKTFITSMKLHRRLWTDPHMDR